MYLIRYNFFLMHSYNGYNGEYDPVYNLQFRAVYTMYHGMCKCNQTRNLDGMNQTISIKINVYHWIYVFTSILTNMYKLYSIIPICITSALKYFVIDINL